MRNFLGTYSVAKAVFAVCTLIPVTVLGAKDDPLIKPRDVSGLEPSLKYNYFNNHVRSLANHLSNTNSEGASSNLRGDVQLFIPFLRLTVGNAGYDKLRTTEKLYFLIDVGHVTQALRFSCDGLIQENDKTLTLIERSESRLKAAWDKTSSIEGTLKHRETVLFLSELFEALRDPDTSDKTKALSLLAAGNLTASFFGDSLLKEREIKGLGDFGDAPGSKGFTIKKPIAFEVTMTTFLKPKALSDELCIWHAVPDPISWDSSGDNSGFVVLDKTPNGSLSMFADSPSKQLLWDFSKIGSEDRSREIQTRYLIASSIRIFDPDSSTATWDDVAKLEVLLHDMKQALAVSGKINGRIDREAKRISEEHPPAKAVLMFCDWVDKHLRYEEDVNFSTVDVDAILGAKKGHCGHYSTLVAEFCRASGIPYRNVWGLNLYAQNGKSSLNQTRADWTNVHTWGEFYLPDIGWIELEPSKGLKAFNIPAAFVQNNFGFQNYRVTKEADGEIKKELRDLSWYWSSGWNSDYVKSNQIKFRRVSIEEYRKLDAGRE